MDLSIIIPFLNEGENISFLVQQLNDYFSKLKNIKTEIVFVDDGSTDDGVEKLKKEKHLFYKAKIIKLSKNFGSHPALRAGILNSTGKVVTFIYADLQDPLDLVSKLYDKCGQNNDIVWAVRKGDQSKFIEKIFSRLYAKLMQKFVIKNYPKDGFDVVMFNDKIKKELCDNIESNSSIFLQILNSGFKQDSIYYKKNKRLCGKSKWTLSKKIKLFIDSFVGFSYFPLRFISLFGVTMSLLGFIWVIYIVSRSIMLHDLTPGWPTLIAVIMIGFGVTNISLGIIAEYLWRTLDTARNRKVFIIDSITELNK